MQILIESAKSSELNVVQNLAHQIWPWVYADILSDDQIAYMLTQMYDLKVLEKQMQQGQAFVLVRHEAKAIGYASYELVSPNEIKIHKLYLLPSYHQKGIGAQIFQYLLTVAKSLRIQSIKLNVNRYNPALKFYQKMGFEIDKEEDIDIGNGYWMNDYVLKLSLSF